MCVPGETCTTACCRNIRPTVPSPSLSGRSVSGLIDVKVHIDGRLASSNADVMLDSTLESDEALKGYAVHPEHVAVANGKVRPYTVQRSCLDFEV